MCFSDGSGNDAQSLNGGNGGPCKNFGRVDGAGGGGYYGGSGGCVYAYGGGGVHPKAKTASMPATGGK